MDTYLMGILAIAAYLIGSISFSYILAKKATGIDIRKVDLKTAGAVNVIINVGPKTGVIAGLLDFLKTLLIVIVGRLIGLSLTLLSLLRPSGSSDFALLRPISSKDHSLWS